MTPRGYDCNLIDGKGDVRVTGGHQSLRVSQEESHVTEMRILLTVFIQLSSGSLALRVGDTRTRRRRTRYGADDAACCFRRRGALGERSATWRLSGGKPADGCFHTGDLMREGKSTSSGSSQRSHCLCSTPAFTILLRLIVWSASAFITFLWLVQTSTP